MNANTIRATKAIKRVIDRGDDPHQLTRDDWLGEPRVGPPTYELIAKILKVMKITEKPKEMA